MKRTTNQLKENWNIYKSSLDSITNLIQSLKSFHRFSHQICDVYFFCTWHVQLSRLWLELSTGHLETYFNYQSCWTFWSAKFLTNWTINKREKNYLNHFKIIRLNKNNSLHSAMYEKLLKSGVVSSWSSIHGGICRHFLYFLNLYIYFFLGGDLFVSSSVL